MCVCLPSRSQAGRLCAAKLGPGPGNGCGSKLNDRRGKPRVLVHGSTYRATHFGIPDFWLPHPNRRLHSLRLTWKLPWEASRTPSLPKGSWELPC